jgi:predicted metal-dependent enzyme (double-stranded beta helix superfamily)
MALDEFLSDLRRRIEAASDSRTAAEQAKAWLQHTLTIDDFIYDLSAFLIDSFKISLPEWRLAPLPGSNTARFYVRVFVWPPLYANEAHEHDNWTVAGVLLNRLEGVAMRRTSVPGIFEELYHFSGGEGDVGILQPPCIHQLVNPTNRTTVSLHVFGGDPGEAEDYLNHGTATQLHDAHKQYREGLKQRTQLAVIEILMRRAPNLDGDLFDRLFEHGSVEAKLAICRAIGRTDPRRAVEYLERLAECIEDDAGARRLREISARIVASL